MESPVLNCTHSLKAAVRREWLSALESSVVKTIGDPNMAVFLRLAAALSAMSGARRALAELTNTLLPLRQQAGVHYGPCIAVMLSDYFGTAVNLASGLKRLLSGQYVVISDALSADPEVLALLNELSDQLSINWLGTTPRSRQHFELWKVILGLVAIPSPHSAKSAYRDSTRVMVLWRDKHY